MDISFAVKFIVCALAVYRAAELIAFDDGPREIFLKLRVRAGAYDRDATGRVVSGWGRLLECPYCVGMWLALAGALALLPFAELRFDSVPHSALSIVYFALYWFALAGAQAFLETVGGRAK